MKVADIMDRDLTSILESCPVEQAIRILHVHRMSGLPVVDEENHVTGFISEKDIVKAALPKYMNMLSDSSFLPDYGQFRKHLLDISNEPVSRFMVTDVITFNEDDSDFNVATIVLKNNIKLAPVLRDGMMVGIISRTHLLEHMLGIDDSSPCGICGKNI